MIEQKVEIVKLILELTDEQLNWVITQLPSILTEEQQELLTSKIAQKGDV